MGMEIQVPEEWNMYPKHYEFSPMERGEEVSKGKTSPKKEGSKTT